MADIGTLQYRVIYGDIDAMGFMYYGHYLRILEAGRNEFCRDNGVSYRDVEAAGFFFPVVEVHLSYKRPARFDDLLTLQTWLSRRTRIRLEFAYSLRRGDEVLLDGTTVHACLGKGGRPVRLPPEFDARFPVRGVLESPPA